LAEAEGNLAGVGAGERHRRADQHGENGGQSKGASIGVAVGEVDEEGDQHQAAEAEDQPPDNVADGADVDHGRRHPRRRAAIRVCTNKGVKAAEFA
jgi:hypothetical protein